MTRSIRRATPADAGALLSIYEPIVLETTISFELTPPSQDEFTKRIESALTKHEWLVMEQSTTQSQVVVCGYAYATPLRPRAAYQQSVETSVYVHPDFRKQGIANALYKALLDSLKRLDFHNAYAGIALPNDASVRLHQSLGFQPIGVFAEVGYKFNRWHDVSWWQRRI